MSGSSLAAEVGVGALADGTISAGSQYALTGTVDPTMVALDSAIGGTAAGAGGWLSSRGIAGAVDDVPRATVVDAFPDSHGVTFFNEQITDIIKTSDAPTFGRPGQHSWVMPVEDAANITSRSAAARYTGAAPSVQDAVVHGERVFGLSVPMEGQAARVPTRADAMLGQDVVNPHFLEGGRTAVRTGDGPTSGYLLNPNREFVTPRRRSDAVR
jgi:hypothetical protein